jgi:flavin-dependent dehydrogenase
VDVAVVGGRCAGSVLALRLAQAGARVTVVDRDPFGSDTLSTHGIWPNTLARLDELGLLDRLLARHDVPLVRYRLRVLGHETVGGFTPVGGFDRMMAPRRVALDPVLAEAAIEAGAECRYGEKVTGLLEEDGRVRGVVLDGGEKIRADWTVGADGRASTVAGKLGLGRERELRGDMAMLLAYWRGLPETDVLTLDMEARSGLSRFPCEDGIQLLVVAGPAELTRGGPEARERAYLSALSDFPTTLDPAALDEAERITEVRSAPETLLRGYFRRPHGPGWALAGDATHFKHPATAQGISDAIEQAIYLADALLREDLDGYADWLDERAAGHYEFSYQFGALPRPELSGPIFEAITSDPGLSQDLRDTMSRQVHPGKVLSPENLQRWLASA